MSKSLVLASALAAATFAASAAQATTTLRTGTNPLCAATGCFANNVYSYQQTFAANTFDGPSAISTLRLDRSLVGDMQGYVVKFSFLRADGTEVANWGGWVLSMMGGREVVSVTGQAFDWDPSWGDLTLKMDLIAPGSGSGGFSSPAPLGDDPFAGRGSSGPSSSVVDGIQAPPPGTETIVSVPEPSTWAMMVLGFGGAGAILRRSRRRRRPVVCVQP
jgi:hypothetical protein